MRQAFLISPSHSHLAQARTVLITTIPEEMCDEKELRLWASFVPGGMDEASGMPPRHPSDNVDPNQMARRQQLAETGTPHANL